MKSDRLARLLEILADISDLSEDERRAYLDETCKGDPELRKEVESILTHESEQYEILKTGGVIPNQLEGSTEPVDMTGRTFSHFRIEEKIAVGGMGVLYRATDLKLDRNVAIKVLRPDLLTRPDVRERFVREARSASALNHPGIVTVYEIDTDSDIDFIAMEYVEGRTLDEMIPPEGMPIESVSGYALQVTEALQAAHEKGIVHRDLKPSNIMITGDNKVKILDFGIAKRLHPVTGDTVEASPDTQITQSGGVIGTLRYLSPEQASGEKVDHRSDIWSLGVMLYEMVSGRVPFAGKDKTALIGAILKETPLPVSEHRSGVPEVLEEIIEKCLEKDREERYQSVDELRADLRGLRQAMATGLTGTWSFATKRSKGWMARRWPWTASIAAIAIIAAGVLIRDFIPFGVLSVSERKKIVVLPFENLGSPEDEYFADGITEELIARLTNIGELGVIARTSAMKYKATDKTIRQIGEELGVDYVIEGTIRWQHTNGESRVRVTPQLIRVSDETHLWAEIYDRDMMDIFRVQSEIAARVAENLDITVRGSDKEAFEPILTNNPEAYQAYLHGLDYFRRPGSDPMNIFTAVEMFEHAVTLDSTFALAYSELSQSHSFFYYTFLDHTEDRISLVRDAAERALELRPNLPESHLAMGVYYASLVDYDRAMEELEIADRLRPNDAEVLKWIGFIWRRKGDFKKALEYVERSYELNPHDLYLPGSMAWINFSLREYQKADFWFDRCILPSPEFIGLYYGKALNLILWKGDVEGARQILEQKPGNPGWLVRTFAWLDLLERKYPSALNHWDSWRNEVESTFYLFVPRTLELADIYGYMGQMEQSQAYYDSARIYLEAQLEEQPDDSRIMSSLGIAYAGLHRKQEAIYMGEMAVQMMPVSLDAIIGPYRVYDLARIYTLVGEYDAAIDQIEYLLSIPSQLSVPLLRISPWCDPLRDHSRFQQLIAEG